MSEFEIFTKFLVAIILGALIGVEREMAMIESHKKKVAGLRTFIFITLLGAVSGYLSEIFLPWFVVPVFAVFAATILAGYWASVQLYRAQGLTTEMSALLAFLLGVICIIGSQTLAIAITVIMVLLLSFKKKFRFILKKITPEELYNTIKFALIAFVILPFLPNQTYGPLDVLNPYVIWLMVVFISAISFFGYILIKILGPMKGIGLTGLLGGLASSTAVTTAMSAESKLFKTITNSFVFAVLIANATSYFRVLFEVVVLNPALSYKLAVPMCVMGGAGLLSAWYIWRQKPANEKHQPKEITLESPFTLGPALKFGIFFAFILFIAKAAQVHFGNTGVYLASIISGLADVDAITISMSRLSAVGEVDAHVAVTAITLAVISNTIVKFFIALLFGSREFSRKIGIVFAIILILGLATTFLV